MLIETDDVGDTTRGYTGTGEQYGTLISQYDGSDSKNPLWDAIGSAAVMADATGSPTDTWRWRAYGELQDHTGSTETPYQFIGRAGYQAEAETDLYKTDDRYYEQATGRWLSCDNPAWTDDYNPYRYVQNDPVNNIDPSGRELICDSREAADQIIKWLDAYTIAGGTYRPGIKATARIVGDYWVIDGDNQSIPWIESIRGEYMTRLFNSLENDRNHTLVTRKSGSIELQGASGVPAQVLRIAHDRASSKTLGRLGMARTSQGASIHTVMPSFREWWMAPSTSIRQADSSSAMLPRRFRIWDAWSSVPSRSFSDSSRNRSKEGYSKALRGCSTTLRRGRVSAVSWWQSEHSGPRKSSSR